MMDNWEPQRIHVTGSKSTLQLILDIHNVDIAGAEEGYFALGLNSFHDEFDTSDKIWISTGKRINVQVDILSTYTDADSKEKLSSDQRRCRLRNEMVKKDTIFLQYSQKRCIFECKLNSAKREARCLPWNIFHSNREMTHAPVCTRNWTSVFEEAFDEKDCSDDCLRDCDGFLYTPVMDTTLLDPNFECLGNPRLQELTFANINTESALFFWRYPRISHWEHQGFLTDYKRGQAVQDDHFDRCVEKVEKDLAFVNILIAPKELALLNMTMKYDLIDQVSIIGNYVLLQNCLAKFIFAKFLTCRWHSWLLDWV